MTEPICSIGELVDKLCIENIKCHFCNHAIQDEQAKPDQDDKRIATLLLASQQANEKRVRLCDAINRQLAKAIKKGEMNYMPTVRTYGL